MVNERRTHSGEKNKHRRAPGRHHARSLAPSQVQIVWHPAIPQDQPRPRYSASEEVGLKYLNEGPLFQMRHLQFAVENHVTTGLPHSIAELDVFHGRKRVALVKSAKLDE